MEAALAQLRVGGVPTAARGTRRKIEDVSDAAGQHKDKDIINKLILAHDFTLRQLVGWAEDVFKMPNESALAPLLLAAVVEWKAGKPPKGAHPQGGVQNAIMGTFIQFVLAFTIPDGNASLKEKQMAMTSLANELTAKNGLQGLACHFNSAHAKETKKGGEVIFKFLVCLRSPFRQYYDLIEAVLSSQRAVRLDGTPPKGTLIRALEAQMDG